MKAISIWQPHASLIICGAKPFETRHWAAPKWVMGQRIAIHASKCTDDLVELAEYIQARKEDGNSEIVASYEAMWKELTAAGFTKLNELPRGAIIGTAVLSECIRSEDLADPGRFGNFGPGRFAWRMTDVKTLAAPITFRGQQGFFNVDDAALAAQGKDEQ